MQRDTIRDLVAFLEVVRAGSFTRAAAGLGLSQSALSHTITRLEARLGLRLLSRTTRSVAPTAAGARLLAVLGPKLDEIDGELAALGELRSQPGGTIRLTCSDHAAETVLLPRLAPLLAGHPDISVEMRIDNGMTDIVAEKLDAGVRLGAQVAKDMIAVRIGPDWRMAVVGTPDTFAARGRPQRPQDLHNHACISLHLESFGGNYAWEFARDGQALRVRVDGQLTFNRVAPILQAARAGLGLALVPEDSIVADLAEGRLVRVLEDWCAPFDGYHLYYPSRRQPSAAFAMVVEALRWR